jgi:hypothetical protein
VHCALGNAASLTDLFALSQDTHVLGWHSTAPPSTPARQREHHTPIATAAGCCVCGLIPKEQQHCCGAVTLVVLCQHAVSEEVCVQDCIAASEAVLYLMRRK